MAVQVLPHVMSSLVDGALLATLVVAGTGKLVDRRNFIKTLQSLRMPALTIVPVSYGVGIAELGVAFGLATPALREGAAVSAAAIFATFSAVSLYVWARGLSVDCSCFGTVLGRLGLFTAARAAALALASIGLAELTVASPETSQSLGVDLASIGLGLGGLALFQVRSWRAAGLPEGFR